MVIQNHLTLEIGPVLQINGKLKMDASEIIELINSKLTITDLIEKTGKSKSTLYLFAKKHNLKIKKAFKQRN